MTDAPAPPSTPAGWYPDPEHAGHQRYWDGSAWTEHRSTVQTVHAGGAPNPNPAALAALILGICGFLLTPIPFFIGLFLGGIPDILAIIFGIVGLVKAPKVGGRGFALALVGLILGGLGFLSIFTGAGTIW
jgi:hypothetical protein